MIFGINSKHLWVGVVLLVCSVFLYMGVGMRNKIPGDTKVNVYIKAINSDRVLKLSTRACYLADVYFKEGITKGVHLKHPQLTFTGNVKEVYYCVVKKNSSLSNLTIQYAPIAGYRGLEGQFDGYTYLKNVSTLLSDTRLLDARGNIEVYGSPERIKIFLKNQPSNVHPMKIEHSRIHRGDVSSSFLYYYDVTSMISEDFMITYEVVATDRDEVTVNSPFPFPIDAEFAREFHQVLKTEGELGILNHPDIIRKFVENNEKVVQYVKSISVEYNDADLKPYVEIVE